MRGKIIEYNVRTGKRKEYEGEITITPEPPFEPLDFDLVEVLARLDKIEAALEELKSKKSL